MQYDVRHARTACRAVMAEFKMGPLQRLAPDDTPRSLRRSEHIVKRIAALILVMAAAAASADTVITMNLVDDKGVGAEAGTVTVTESKYGLVFTPALHGLAPGLHGFHVHEFPNCAPKEKDGKMVPALAAGGHLDPAKTNKHGEPWGDGHLGDLAPLYVDQDGNSTQPCWRHA